VGVCHTWVKQGEMAEIQGTAEDVKRQGETTWQKIKETVSGSADKATDTAAEVQRRAGETAEQYQRRLEQYAEAAKHQAQVCFNTAGPPYLYMLLAL
jgi:ElaB/YqjD/DUF883 family membrane-anchored ribosome-binding protein